MTFYDFLQLDETAQAIMTWELGVHIAERSQGGRCFLLYQINSDESFYVEVTYYSVQNKIKKIRAFKSLRPLEPYLDEIDLDLF